MTALEVHYDAGHVVLTLGMAFIGPFSAVSLCEQYRLATLSATKKKRHLVLMLVALALGWGGTWSAHAVGLSSIELYNGDIKIPVRYNAVIVVLAAIQSVVQIYIGMVVASTDECFNKSRTEIIELFVARTSSARTLEEIKKIGKWQIMFIVCTLSLERTIIGGLTAGSAVAVMFYTMLQSLKFEGTIEYDAGIVFASFVFAMFNGVGAFWTFFRLLSLFPSLDLLRSMVAFLGINAISGMFYIGMAALTFQYNPGSERAEAPTSSASIRPGNLYTGGVCSCVIVVCVMLMFVISDLRSWLLRTSTQLRQADKVIDVLTRKLRAASKNHSTPLELVQYTRLYQNRESFRTTSEKTTDTRSTASPVSAAGAGAKKYHSLYNDYDEEEGIDSETGSNGNNSAHGEDTGGVGQSTCGATGNLRVQGLQDEKQMLTKDQEQQQQITEEVLLHAAPGGTMQAARGNSQMKSLRETTQAVSNPWSGSAKVVPTDEVGVAV